MTVANTTTIPTCQRTTTDCSAVSHTSSPVVNTPNNHCPPAGTQVSRNSAAGIQATMISRDRGDLTAVRRRYRSDHSAEG